LMQTLHVILGRRRDVDPQVTVWSSDAVHVVRGRETAQRSSILQNMKKVSFNLDQSFRTH
jgi:hypothetical protein